MKQRITIFLLLTALLMAACSKDDFMELRHPIVMEGEFDPVFGIPVAKMSADVATMVGMLDFNQDVTVYIGEDDIVSFDIDTVLIVTKKTLVSNWCEEFKVHTNITPKTIDNKRGSNYYVLLSTARVIVTNFETISGELERMKLFLKTRNVAILDHYNLKTVVEHRPTSVDYTVRMCITIPTEQMAPGSDFAECMETLGVDSMMCDLHACLELPLNFYSRHITYFDTIPLNLSNLKEQLDNIGEGVINGEHYTVNLNDSNCYLAFVAKNHIPVEAIFNCTFLDEFDNPILSTIFDGDRAILPAPTIPLDGHQNTWCSNGATETQFKIHLSLNDLKQLCNTRRLHYSIELSTANQDLPGIKPFVAVKIEDKIDIRSYVVLSPHADFSIPLELPSFPTTK